MGKRVRKRKRRIEPAELEVELMRELWLMLVVHFPLARGITTEKELFRVLNCFNCLDYGAGLCHGENLSGMAVIECIWDEIINSPSQQH